VRDTQDRLESLVHGVLCRNPSLYYYQGFHDVCLLFLLVLGETKAFVVSERVGQFYLRDAMSQTLSPVVELLALIYPLVKLEDPALYAFLEGAGSKPFYSLSWVITWFAHDISKRETVERIFDFLISSDPLMPVYLSAAFILEQRDQILAQEQDGDVIHGFMSSQLRHHSHTFDFDHLILIADRLHRLHPPSSLQQSTHITLSPE